MSKHDASLPKIVIRLSHMGDVALTSGVLDYWHRTKGDTFIYVTRPGNAPVLENHPAVVETLTYDGPALKDVAWFRECGSLATRFKGHELVDLHGTLRSRILSLRWKGSVRRYPKFGLARRLFNKTGAARFRTELEKFNVPQRYAMAYTDLPPEASELLPRIFLSEAETQAAEKRLARGESKRPQICLHPYATHPAKSWPREHWLTLTAQLAVAGIEWFVIGRNDEPLFMDHENDLTNQTGLRETCALMAQADAVITNDSGPMHLAAGVGTPVVALFGPTAKAWGFYPAGPRDTVLEHPLDCRPCSLHGARTCAKGFECMVATTPEMVMESIRKTLGKY